MQHDHKPQYMTVVLALPDDPEARSELVRRFGRGARVDGAVVEAILIGDAIDELDRLGGLSL